jgi:predicted GH43/DUF377 family glycosyl hydrolase
MKNLVTTCVLSCIPFFACYTAFAQTHWEKHTGNPVLVGGPGAWDQLGVLAMGVLLDSATYHMWYAGRGTGGTALGYATSTDGITWTKHPANPVLAEAGSPSVMRDGSSYRMWYDVNRQIRYATSPDRVTWTNYAGNPVLNNGAPGQWDRAGVFNPAVVLEGSTYHMWYAGWDSVNTRIGYATSTDGIAWTKFAGNPVLDVGSIGSWDSAAVLSPSVVLDGSTFHMWYEGGAVMSPAVSGLPIDGRIGYATSSNGIAWTKYVGNPVIDTGAQSSWDGRTIFGKVIKEGSKYHMWYSGFGGNPTRWRIGYAVDSTTATGLNGQNITMPSEYSLGQNYPNPFNPSTTIGFGLPFRSRVRLAIFTVLGQRVAELADEDANAGFHERKWTSAVASGIYFYRLEAVSLDDRMRQFVEVRKMLLLR